MIRNAIHRPPFPHDACSERVRVASADQHTSARPHRAGNPTQVLCRVRNVFQAVEADNVVEALGRYLILLDWVAEDLNSPAAQDILPMCSAQLDSTYTEPVVLCSSKEVTA